ncbi:MAG: hypothetical protein ACI4ED_09840 [Suilimivivens sp.]
MTGKKRRQLNNSGSTLIVVLVAVSFLIILASIIITVSSANLRMKQIEYAMKQNFYVDEIGLDDIYNGIGRDVSNALAKSYSQTLIEANVAGKYPTQKAAYIAFAGTFKNELITLYGDAGDVPLEETINKLNAYISRIETDEQLQVESYQGVSIVGDPETGADLWQYILKDVKVKYIKDDKYESVITTDIVIEVPYINFFQDFTQLLDYSLIGNKGIYFNNANSLIEGNVYAGIDSAENNAAYNGYLYDTGLYDGMNFYKSVVKFNDSSYVISKGDFNICESAVTIESKLSDATGEAQSNLWAENIRTVENGKPYSPIINVALTPSSLNATANIYVADDLELNARNSSVTLNGNYYGYNYNNSGSSIYSTFENENIKDKYVLGDKMQAAHTTSSSIVMNAMNSTLDLTGLRTLMVAGVAYIDIKDGEKAYSAMTTGEGQEMRTGESIAMRYNQFLYLAPTDILKDVSNPQKDGSTKVEEVCPIEDNLKLADWFGQEYLDKSKPVIPVVYQDNGQSYTYYYLNILEGKEEAYIKAVMSATDPGETGTAADKQKWELKQEIERKASNANISSHITIKAGSESGVKIYTTGLLTDTEEAEKTLKKNGISLDDMAGRSTNMQKHYAQLYVNLDQNSIESVDNSKKISTDYPLANFLDVHELASGKLPNLVAGREVPGVKNAKVWIVDSSINPVLDLSGEKGIVLCDGNLTIQGNGTFEGLIIATGKITVKDNLTVKANRGVVQAVLESEQRSVLETEKSKVDEIKVNDYASHYFLNTVLVGLSNLDKEDLINMEKRVTSTDYTDYIYYENWRKGETAASP